MADDVTNNFGDAKSKNANDAMTSLTNDDEADEDNFLSLISLLSKKYLLDDSATLQQYNYWQLHIVE